MRNRKRPRRKGGQIRRDRVGNSKENVTPSRVSKSKRGTRTPTPTGEHQGCACAALLAATASFLREVSNSCRSSPTATFVNLSKYLLAARASPEASAAQPAP